MARVSLYTTVQEAFCYAKPRRVFHLSDFEAFPHRTDRRMENSKSLGLQVGRRKVALSSAGGKKRRKRFDPSRCRRFSAVSDGHC